MGSDSFVSTECATEKQLQQAGARCVKYVRDHMNSRPKPTGIAAVESRSSDVVVTTFPKSGTTLMQHMCYQIVAMSGGGPAFDRTGLEFPDLSVVSPWIDYIPQIRIPPCESNPRVFKTHSPVTAFPANEARHIVVVRDPTAYPSSWLDFLFDALVPGASEIGVDVREAAFHECVRQDLLTAVDNCGVAGVGAWHSFVLKSVFPIREKVLVMFYEQIVRDMDKTVCRVAKFMGCELNEREVKEVVRRCDRDSMAADSRFFCRIENKCFGVSKDVPKAKSARKDGFRRFHVKEEQLRALENMNERAFGVRTYAELCEMVCKTQEALFGR